MPCSIAALAAASAAICAANGSYKLKLATADREIKTLSLKDFADTDENHYGQNGSPTRVVRVFPPEHNTLQERWEGSGKENATRLAAFLEEGKFLQNPR